LRRKKKIPVQKIEKVEIPEDKMKKAQEYLKKNSKFSKMYRQGILRKVTGKLCMKCGNEIPTTKIVQDFGDCQVIQWYCGKCY
jgi:hypothetical protein